MTNIKDFLWPLSIVTAKYINFSPYKMLVTNILGISWTIYNCYSSE